MRFSPTRSSNKKAPPVLTDMQRQYEAETGSTMFSQPKSPYGGRNPQRRKSERQAYASWEKTTAGMDAGKNRFNAMMANRSQNPVLGQTQPGMSGFDKFQAMQAGRNVPTLGQPSSVTASGMNGMLQAIGDIMRTEQRNAAQDGKLNQADYDRFQAQMGANPLILQQLQMGQRQMGPQFNTFGFGAQPGLAAQGGQGGSMLGNMSSQGMNQLAAGQQNNPTIFKAKS
jgi:hypothetical protein